MKPIMILEDDMILNAGLCYNLNLDGYETEPAYNIADARTLFQSKEYSLLILDGNLPDGNGFEFSEWVRHQSKVPVIFLTACDMDEDIIKGFCAGADDYITKPFNAKILMQRIQAILRRTENEGKEDQEIWCGNLKIELETYRVEKSGKPLELTRTEYKLLHKFCQNKGIVLTREILLDALWDQQGNFVDEHTLTINISRLRAKIADDEYTYIKTIYGMGYQWIGEKHE